jgi:hypothetical protein
MQFNVNVSYINIVSLSLCAGAAYVFVLSGGVGSAWTQAQKLLASDGGVGDYFGRSVALNGDLLVISAHFGNNEIDSNTGGLYRHLD